MGARETPPVRWEGIVVAGTLPGAGVAGTAGCGVVVAAGPGVTGVGVPLYTVGLQGSAVVVYVAGALDTSRTGGQA